MALVCVNVLGCFSRVRLFGILQTEAHQAPLCMGFSRQEHWSGLPCPPPGVLPNPGDEPASSASPALQEDSLPTEPPGKPISIVGRAFGRCLSQEVKPSCLRKVAPGLPGGSVAKNLPADVGAMGSVSGPGGPHMLRCSEARVPPLLSCALEPALGSKRSPCDAKSQPLSWRGPPVCGS